MLLEALLEQVKAGQGQVVSLVGAPGMGKSRLLDEFRQRLIGQHVRYAEGQCLAYGSGIALSSSPGPAAGSLWHRRGRSSGGAPTKVRPACSRRASIPMAQSCLISSTSWACPERRDRFADLSAEGRKRADV